MYKIKAIEKVQEAQNLVDNYNTNGVFKTMLEKEGWKTGDHSEVTGLNCARLNELRDDQAIGSLTYALSHVSNNEYESQADIENDMNALYRGYVESKREDIETFDKFTGGKHVEAVNAARNTVDKIEAILNAMKDQYYLI